MALHFERLHTIDTTIRSQVATEETPIWSVRTEKKIFVPILYIVVRRLMVGMVILRSLLISFKFRSLITVLTLKLKALFYKVL